MNIKYTKFNGTGYAKQKKAVYEFKVTGSLLKTHFKALARISFLFKRESGVYQGFILPSEVDQFLKLCEKANKVDSDKAKKSHEKAKVNYKKKKEASSCQHEDLGSLGYKHGSIVTCPHCGKKAEVW